MSLTNTTIYQFYQEYVEDAGDPRTKDWFLINSPIPSIWITIAYFLMVTQIGPNYMKGRQPFKLKKIILTYNALQVVLNLGILYLIGIRFVINEKLFCMEVLTEDNHRNHTYPTIGWIYFMMKFLDMVDTVFFVLTKKQNHISFLHLFHHMSMIGVSWFGVKYYPSGVLAVAPYLNTWVHAMMYSYYFCALYYGKVGMKWKKLMTTIQLVIMRSRRQHAQFLVGTFIFAIHMVNPWCNFPKWLLIPVVLHGFTFIYMFGQFYYKSYVISNTKKVQ